MDANNITRRGAVSLGAALGLWLSSTKVSSAADLCGSGSGALDRFIALLLTEADQEKYGAAMTQGDAPLIRAVLDEVNITDVIGAASANEVAGRWAKLNGSAPFAPTDEPLALAQQIYRYFIPTDGGPQPVC